MYEHSARFKCLMQLCILLESLALAVGKYNYIYGLIISMDYVLCGGHRI